MAATASGWLAAWLRVACEQNPSLQGEAKIGICDVLIIRLFSTLSIQNDSIQFLPSIYLLGTLLAKFVSIL